MVSTRSLARHVSNRIRRGDGDRADFALVRQKLLRGSFRPLRASGLGKKPVGASRSFPQRGKLPEHAELDRRLQSGVGSIQKTDPSTCFAGTAVGAKRIS